MLNLNKLSKTIGHRFLAIAFLTITACGQSMSEEQMLDKAKTYLDKGNPKAATLELRNVLQKNNRNAEARFLLGNVSLKIGDFATAEKEFGRATLAGWDQQQTQLALARIFVATKKFQKLLDEITIQDTWSPDTRANISALRAIAEASLNKTQQAQSTLEEARSTKPNAFQVLKATAMFQLTGLQNGDAEQTLTQALLLYPDNNELLFIRASHYMQNKKLSAATDTYKKIINNEPPNLTTADGHKAKIGLARLQIIQNNLDEAIATLTPLLNKNDNDPEANYLRGLISFSKKEYNQAEDYIRKLLAVIPNHNRSQHLMGEIKYTLKEFEQASHHLSQYLKASPDDTPARKLLTQTYIKLNAPKQALSTLQPLLTQNPDDAATLALLSQITFIKGDLNESIAALKQARKSAPKNVKLQKQLVKAYISAGKTEQALKEIKRLQTLSNNTEEIQKLTVSAYLRTGKIKQAIKVANKMLETDPKNPEVIALNGTLYAENNDWKQARNYFNKALKLHKNLPSAIVGLARLERKEGNLNKSIALYNKLIESNQGGILPMLALSELAEQQKRTNDMLSWLEKARTAEPKDLKSRIILANYYLRNSQPDKASIYIQEALKTSPEHAELLALHGRILIAQKRFSEALPLLKTLVRNHPDSITAHLLIGETFLRLNKAAKAREHLQAVLKKQPDNFLANILMAEVEFKAGNYNRSLSYAKKLQHTQPELFPGYTLEGNVQMARQHYNRARSAYNEAWKREQSADLAKKLFIASKHVVTPDEAIKPLLTWLKQHPEDNHTRLFLASIYQSEKQTDMAISEYLKILEKNPDDSAALNNLAWSYLLENNSEALDMAERAYRLAPEHSGIQDTYGWILTQQGQPEKGLRLLKQAIQTLPDNMEVRFHLASALIKSGENARGKQMLKELLKKNKPFEGKEQATQLLQRISE